MFGLVGYIMICFAVGCVFTIIVGMFRPIKQHDDWKAWKVLVGTMLAVGTVPYGYVEAMTASKGAKMKSGVLEAIHEAELVGKLTYFKVITADEKKAHVIASATDRNEFGHDEPVMMEIDLKKDAEGWHPDSYSIISSFKRQRDASTMPPYW